MTDAAVLVPALEPDAAPLAAPRRSRRLIAIGAIAAAALAAAGQVAFWHYRNPSVPPPAQSVPPVRVTAQQKADLAQLNVDDKAQIVVSGKAAEARNQAIPFSRLPLEHVRALLLAEANKGTAYATALTCLSQAVYYEAATEPMEGRRAVAQVVLNRMRHPAYPKSVCGVVYEGAERQTGCQFSFTCDGSLLRPAGGAPWREAQEVARAALAGHVEASVGTATHYHADYVLPKWAFTLAKVEQIGRHIFYRFPNGWGGASAFTGAWSGRELIPALDFSKLHERQAELDAAKAPVDGEVLTDGLTPGHGPAATRDPRDSGGRVNVTKLWRMKIAGAGAESGLRSADDGVDELKPLPVSNSAASARE